MTKTKHQGRNGSEKSIHHVKEIKKIEKKNKPYTATVKINRTKKEFVFVTGSLITIIPPDRTILKLTGTQTITNKSQDVNKNEVFFRGKIPVDLNSKNQTKNGNSNNRKNR